LTGIFLSGGGQLLDVSANFLSGFRDPCFIHSLYQSVSFQNPVDHFVHSGTPNIQHRNNRSATFRLSGVKEAFGWIEQRAYFVSFRPLMLTPSRPAVILILDTHLFSRAANIAARTTGIPPPPRPLRRSIASALFTTAEQFGFPQNSRPTTSGAQPTTGMMPVADD
jgi:hypothetical protein